MSAHSRKPAFPTKRVLLGATAAAVAAVIFGSVQTTGALWRDSGVRAAGVVTAATFSLSPGVGTDPNFTFTDLAKPNITVGDFVQKPLTIANTGTARNGLTYFLSKAGPSVTAGPGVTITLSGTVVPTTASCTDTNTPTGTAAFTTFDTASTTTAATSSPRTLAKGASEIWCIRSTLKSVVTVTPPASSTFTIAFAFRADQK
ncbi:hypothetical protein GCM10007304_10130 [Rhodococcoides trifolii]|uniref:Uncharacterized protein n=1 Tax=Rhodococcoides trifolii TaxID=908250 RepID=A0A917CTY5_9NOCA|nr:hypothetical protein [Rhodococcus trifolii]GGF98131.1 hypothetical protein GCM10007304_10130 [Rhodococcus trifolii]